MIERSRWLKEIRTAMKRSRVTALVGPRQSGKTTLCRHAFSDLAYVNLEALDHRDFASTDPRGFLRRYGGGAIIDEIQRAPDLLSYVQEHVDERGGTGLFVLTGICAKHARSTSSRVLAT